MTIDVEIPVYLIHWNAPDWITRSVASIDSGEGARVRVVVIENGGPGGQSVANALGPGVRFLPLSANVGFTGGANAALRDWLASDSPAPYAIIGSHDLHVERDTVASLARDLDTHPDVGIIGPAIEFVGHYRGPWGTIFDRLPKGAGVVDGNWVSGTCMMIRLECARAVGEFDESFGSYVEDVDYCLRAVDAGWRVCVDSDAFAHGLGSADGGSSGRLIPYNHLRLAKKRFGNRGLALGILFRGYIGLRRAGAAIDFRRSSEARHRAWIEGRDNLRVVVAGIRLFTADRRP
jgi:GT2 family glycosyltransferase